MLDERGQCLRDQPASRSELSLSLLNALTTVKAAVSSRDVQRLCAAADRAVRLLVDALPVAMICRTVPLAPAVTVTGDTSPRGSLMQFLSASRDGCVVDG